MAETFSPTISVITVVFNGGMLLEGTIRSVAAQTYPHVEYIVVDGNSRDNTVEVIRQHEDKITRWISEPDKGIYDAMNKGLHLATGDYVLFMNCGDHFFAPDTLAKVAAYATPDTDILYGETMIVNEAREELGLMSEVTTRPLPEGLNWRSFRYGMCVCHQSFLPRRTLAPDYRLHHSIAADIDWCIRIMKQSKKIVHTHEVVARYLTGGMSMKRQRESLRSRFHVLSEHFGLVPNVFAHAYIVLRGLWFKWKRRGDYSY